MNNQKSDVIEFHEVKAYKLENKGSGNGGGGNMDNFVTRKEFEQFEKRIDENLKTINTNIEKLPDRLDEKLEGKIEKMKNKQLIFFISTILTILGVAGRVFGLY